MSTVSHVLQDPQHLCIGTVCTCPCMYARWHLQRWPGGSARGLLISCEFYRVMHDYCSLRSRGKSCKSVSGEIMCPETSVRAKLAVTAYSTTVGPSLVPARAFARFTIPSYILLVEAKWRELEGHSQGVEVTHEDYQHIHWDQQLDWCCLAT